MRKIIFLSLLFTSSSILAQKTVWTKRYRDTVYRILYASNNTITNDKDRVAFTICNVDKFQAKYPEGLEKHSKAELNSAGVAIGMACEKEVMAATIIKWTPQSEATIRKAFEATAGLQVLKPEILNMLTDCIILKLKQKYPHGIVFPLKQEVQEEIQKSCFDQIVKVK